MSSSVSSKTDYLIAGKEPGANKIDGAREHNIPLLTEKEFLGMLTEKSNWLDYDLTSLRTACYNHSDLNHLASGPSTPGFCGFGELVHAPARSCANAEGGRMPDIRLLTQDVQTSILAS